MANRMNFLIEALSEEKILELGVGCRWKQRFDRLCCVVAALLLLVENVGSSEIPCPIIFHLLKFHLILPYS